MDLTDELEKRLHVSTGRSPINMNGCPIPAPVPRSPTSGSRAKLVVDEDGNQVEATRSTWAGSSG